MKRRTSRQLTWFRFKGFRRNQRLQKLLGSIKGHALYKLGDRFIVEERSFRFVNFHELNEKGQPNPFCLAEGALKVNPSLYKSVGPVVEKFVEKKNYGIISYQLFPKYRTREFLRKGIGVRMLKAMEEMAREEGLEVIIAKVRHENKASIGALHKQRFRKLRNSPYYYKLLK